MNHGWRFITLYRRQGSRPSSRKKNAKVKWLSEEALQIAVRRREVKNQGGFVGPTKELGMCIMAREIKTQKAKDKRKDILI